MERREQPRVQLPLEIDLRHPVIGTKRVVARDLNDDGIFAWYPGAPLKVGSALDVTLRRPSMIESGPTPTVKMTVLRRDANGIALSFSNKAGSHLWRSASPTTRNLEIGKDLFRVFQAAIIRDPAGKLLTVQQNGRWLFPGTYLQGGQHWQEALVNFARQTLNLTAIQFERTVHTHCDPEVVALESSTMSVFHLFSLASSPSTGSKVKLSVDSDYSQTSWIKGYRQLTELSFSAEPLRELARSLLPNDFQEPPAYNRKHG